MTASLVGFCGVLLISKPEFITSYLRDENTSSNDKAKEGKLFGVLINILSGIFYAIIAIICRISDPNINVLVYAYYENIG